MRRIEKLVMAYRQHIELFYYKLFYHIRKKNPTLFKDDLPKAVFEPLRLDSDEYLKQVATLWMKGKFSDESAMEKYGFNYQTEVDRRKREKKNDELFMPKATNPQNPGDTGQDDEGGRPPGTPDSEERGLKGKESKGRGIKSQLT